MFRRRRKSNHGGFLERESGRSSAGVFGIGMPAYHDVFQFILRPELSCSTLGIEPYIIMIIVGS